MYSRIDEVTFHINGRYILFKWNDSDDEMDKARHMAAEFGVDRLTWEITDHPEDSFSRRFAPGTADFSRIQHEVWDQSGLGNAIAGATPRAEIDVRAASDVLSGKAGETLTIETRVKNLSSRPFRRHASYGRRLVRLGAQLVGADGMLINRDHARAWLPGDIPAGGAADVAIEVPLPDAPGRYALKFDLVSEGIDWFEKAGSKTTTRDVVVQ